MVHRQQELDGTLKTGDVLKPGSVIRTAESRSWMLFWATVTPLAIFPWPWLRSTARFPPVRAAAAAAVVRRNAGNVVRIFAMTVLGVDKLIVDRTGVDEVSDTQLDLRAGQIFVNVKKLSKQSRYEVKIPNGVAGIRGTGVLISSVGIVETQNGDVIISVILGNGTQVTLEVPTGEWFNPTSGVVAQMSEADKQKLDAIYKDLGVFVKALETLLGKDFTIHFCSPVDGTSLK